MGRSFAARRALPSTARQTLAAAPRHLGFRLLPTPTRRPHHPLPLLHRSASRWWPTRVRGAAGAALRQRRNAAHRQPLPAPLLVCYACQLGILGTLCCALVPTAGGQHMGGSGGDCSPNACENVDALQALFQNANRDPRMLGIYDSMFRCGRPRPRAALPRPCCVGGLQLAASLAAMLCAGHGPWLPAPLRACSWRSAT